MSTEQDFQDQLDRIEDKLDALLANEGAPVSPPADDEAWGNANGAFSPPGFPNGKWWPDHTKGSQHAQSFFETHVNMYMGTERSLPEGEDGEKIPADLETIYPYGPKCGTPEEYRADVEFASRYRGTPDENFG